MNVNAINYKNIAIAPFSIFLRKNIYKLAHHNKKKIMLQI